MKLLVIEPRSLFPCDSGAKILSSNILAHLCKRHDVTLLVNVDPDAPAEDQRKMKDLCAELVTVPWRELRNFTFPFYLELARCLVAGQLYAVKKFCTPALKQRAGGLADVYGSLVERARGGVS